VNSQLISASVGNASVTDVIVTLKHIKKVSLLLYLHIIV